MGLIELYRRRLIPDQNIALRDDEIVYYDDNILVTRWKTLKPKKGFDHGSSCYFLGSGIKLNKFYKPDGELLYWYCDIVDYDFDKESNKLTVTDLLADVIVHPDGRLQVIDLDELSDATRQHLITECQTCSALDRLDFLLKCIYSGDFNEMKETLNKYEKL